MDPQAAAFEEFRAHYPTCPDCAGEVERLSRVESALRGPSGEGAHPDTGALLALERQPETLPADQRELLSAHLDGCAPCRAALRALRGFDPAAARGSVPEARPRAAGTRRAPPPRKRMSPGLLAAALAAALVIAVALPLYLLRETEPTGSVAVVEPEPLPEPVVPREPETLPETRVVHEPVETPEPEAAPAPAPREPQPVLVTEQTPEPRAAPELEAPPPEPVEIAMVFPSTHLAYSPPGGADPVLQRWRVPGVVRISGGPGLRIQALAPDHTGLTAEPSDRSSEVVSGGSIERVVPDATLVARLHAAGPGSRAHVLAEAGLFHDALDVLSRWTAASPQATAPRRDRAALLEAVGLGKALPREGIGTRVSFGRAALAAAALTLALAERLASLLQLSQAQLALGVPWDGRVSAFAETLGLVWDSERLLIHPSGARWRSASRRGFPSRDEIDRLLPGPQEDEGK